MGFHLRIEIFRVPGLSVGGLVYHAYKATATTGSIPSLTTTVQLDQSAALPRRGTEPEIIKQCYRT